MKCSRCQHENRAGAKFCEECAAPLALTCGHCGGQLSPTAKFCPECAHPTGSASTAPTTTHFASPESYTPKHLAEKILTSKAALEGERKQVTVLFADLKGSMELLADRDPEDARKILDPVIEHMMEAVHRHEGTVNHVQARLDARGRLQQPFVRATGCAARVRCRRDRNTPRRSPREHAERLAHHAFRGGEWDKAVRYGREAAMKAVGRWANHEATAYIEQALDALGRLPESQRTREMAVDLRLDLYAVLLPLDQLRPLLERLHEAERLAMALEDRERLGWARLHLCHVGGLLAADLRPMMKLAFDVISIAQGIGNQRMEADGYFWAGCWAYALGEHRRAVDLLLKGVDVRTVRQPGQPARDVGRSGYVAMFLAELGDFAESRREAEITLRARQATPGHPWNLMNTCWQIALSYALQGDLDRAQPLADQAIELGRQWGFSTTRGMAMCVLGRILLLSGRAMEAVELLEQGLRHSDAGRTWLRCRCLADLGEAYLSVGRAQEAAACAMNAVESARERGERGFEAWALRLQAEVALAARPPDAAAAERRYGEAKALAGALGMRPLAAHCHFGLGKLFRATGKEPEARESLVSAMSMYREMDMRLWLEQAQNEIANLA
jgi:class 3 adenylate cyclase